MNPMPKPTDVRPTGVKLYLLPIKTRMPLKFGTEITTEVTCARVRVRVHDVRGSIVATLLDDERPAGGHTVHWDGHDHNGADVASGVYLVSVMAGGSSATVRVALVR